MRARASAVTNDAQTFQLNHALCRKPTNALAKSAAKRQSQAQPGMRPFYRQGDTRC